MLCIRIGNVCTETLCYALHNNFQALVLPCQGCVGCACCAAYQPTHRFVVARRQDPNLGKSGLALTPILQWGQIALVTAFASEGQEGVTSDVIPFHHLNCHQGKRNHCSVQYGVRTNCPDFIHVRGGKASCSKVGALRSQCRPCESGDWRQSENEARHARPAVSS